MSATRHSRPPLTLSGRTLLIARLVWVALALFGVTVDITTLPVFYQHALSLHSTHCCVARNAAEWRLGLQQLHLTPAIYAGIALGSQIVLSSAMFLIGLIIFLRKSDEWIGLFISIVLVSFGLVANNTEPVGFPGWMLSITDAYNNCAYLSFFVIPLVFPDGRFVPRWTAGALALGLLAAFAGPHAPHTLLDSSTWPGAVNAALVLVFVGTILLSPVYRYIRVSTPGQREQTKWVMFALVLAIGVFLLVGSVIPNVPGITANPMEAVLVDIATGTALGAAFLFVPLGFAVAILRYKLWDIDTLINRTLVYGSLTVSLVGAYLVAVIAIQSVFRAITGQGSDVAVAIATLAVAALFNPWRRRLQAFIDRRFFRSKYNAARTLTAFSTRLRDELDMDQLSANLLSVAHDTMQPASLALWLRDTEGGRS